MTGKTLTLKSKIIVYTVLTFFLLIWSFPIYIAVTKSFNVNGLGNYAAVLNHPKIDYFRVVFNTLFVAGATAAIVALLTTLASFAFSKMKFIGQNFFYILLLACLAVPAASVTSPMFFTVKSLGIMNSYLALILPLVAFNAPLMLLIVKNYFDGIPNEMLEAATIDGCSVWGIYTQVMLPLSVPIIANILVLTFVYAWNDYLIPLLFTRK